jgi:hypothetical protein
MLTQLTISITAIDRDYFPWFASFEVVDSDGKVHHFVDKAPVIGLTVEEENATDFPFTVTVACIVVAATPTSALVDTSKPYGIESLSGETQFNVPISAVSQPFEG